MNLSDQAAMNELSEWMERNDPVLDGNLPNWVWDLTALIDDLICETGRA